MTIDSHTHVFEAGHGGPFGLPCSADDLVRQMDAHGVDCSVVLPLPGVATNEFVQRVCSRSAGRLIGLYNPEFDVPRETITKMEAFFRMHSPKGLKIHPRLQGVTVNDSVVEDVICWADERGLPVIFDAFLFGESLDNMALHPLAYHRVAQKRPGLKLILAHAGGYKLMEAFMVSKANPNVFLDISFTPVYFKNSSLADDCGFLCRRMRSGRLLYGSDFPHVPFGESLEMVRQFLGDCDESVRIEVLGGTAANLFGILRA